MSTRSDTRLVLTREGVNAVPKELQKKTWAFIGKLTDNDALPGLHIEPMHHAVDSRARTARIDQKYRAVLFQLTGAGGTTYYVFDGVYDHDDAIRRARSIVCRINPINNMAELIYQEPAEGSAAAAPAVPADVSAASTGGAAGLDGGTDPGRELPGGEDPESTRRPRSVLAELGITLADLTDTIGIDTVLAEQAMHAATDDQLQRVIESVSDDWRGLALLDLATGTNLGVVAEQYRGLPHDVEAGATTDEAIAAAQRVTTASIDGNDQRIIDAMSTPAGAADFAFIDGADDPELRRVLAEGSFSAWRVFLHPTQRQYVDREYNGPFRLTGGAGTGKTVVLLHRARRLALQHPDARIVVTTYGRSLADTLLRQLVALDPQVPIATRLGQPGVHVAGVDQLAAEVLRAAGDDLAQATQAVLGWPWRAVQTTPDIASFGKIAKEVAAEGASGALRSGSFLEAEYEQVVLPGGVLKEADYLRMRRPGRGVRLGRRERQGVWQVMEAYRSAMHYGSADRVGFSEACAIAAEWLQQRGGDAVSFADHVLVDEAQDLSPVRFQLLRALVPQKRDDLFIAEDPQQRIYGHPVVLGRLGIRIVGRSRRLTLNYRTTEQNLAFAVRALQGGEFSDLEGEALTSTPYRSARSGPEVTVLGARAQTDEQTALADTLRRWVSEMDDPSTIAVLARSRKDQDRLAEELDQAGVTVTVVRRDIESGGRHPLLLTMHRAKGLEFARVILVGVDLDHPAESAPKWHSDDPDSADAELRERSLLYVAASRARDLLVVVRRG